ncbi:MAG: IclR family transcriptional regulator, partial [Canibacter sp.]
MEPTKVKGVDSARRVLQILLSFIETSPSVTVDEIADKFQISKPSAYRYISVLRELYFIEEKKRGEFVLTSQMFRLAEVAEQSIDVAAVSRPVLDRLMRETGETVLVLKRSRDSAICIASSVPNVPATISFTPGHHMPLHRGAGPKLLLACSSMDFRERYLT